MKILKKIKFPVLILAVAVILIALVACDTCTEHELVLEATTAEANCKTEGAQTYVCTLCGARVEQSIPKTDAHSFGDWSTVSNATATTDGLKIRSCTDCGTTEELLIPAFGASAEVLTSTVTVDIDLSEYKIVYPNVAQSYPSVTATFKLVDAIEAATGARLDCGKQASLTESAKEILVGETNRPESKAALAGIEGNGFAIHVINDKIVIVGSGDVQTARAVQYFIDEYFGKAVDATAFTMSESTIAYNCDVLDVMDSDGAKVDIVYDKDLDDDRNHSYTSSVGDDCRSYPVQVAHLLAKAFAQESKLDVADFVVRRSDTVIDKEIIIGAVEGNELENSFRATLGADEYGILVTADKIILTAHNDYALNKGYQRLKSEVLVSKYQNDEGNTAWGLPIGYTIVESANENWVTDFPSPEKEGIEFSSSLSLGQDTLQFLYEGEGITEAAYEAYKAELIEAGYSVYYENEIEGSKFVTLTNDEMMLYVAYNAFAHADEEHNTDDSIHVLPEKYPYIDYKPLLRVVSTPIEIAYLPDSDLFEPQDYDKVTETSITQIKLPNADIGYAYVITLEDGRFIVMDGGWDNSTGPEDVWTALCALYEEVWGHAPTAEQPIDVAAWYVSHGHHDHTFGVVNLMRKYYPQGLIKIDKMIANYPDISSVYNGAYDVIWSDENLKSVYIEELDMEYNKVFAGQVLHIANVELEVLMTFSDHHPVPIENANDTNTVIKFYIHHKDAPETTNTLLILGDGMLYSSRFLCAMYGSYLESDIVELSHHGNIGSDMAMYEISQPTAILYPNATGAYNDYINPSKANQWPHSVSNYVVRELTSLKYVYVQGLEEAITIPCAADGSLDYENIYNVVTGEKIPYEENSLFATTTPAIRIPEK